MRILLICLWLGGMYGVESPIQLQAQSNDSSENFSEGLSIPTDRASLKALFEELKESPYEYEAVLSQEQYRVGEEGTLMVRVRKGGYDVAGKSVKIVPSQPLLLEHYVRSLPSESEFEPESADSTKVTPEFVLAEPGKPEKVREALGETFKTDWAGEVRIKFRALEAGQHRFYVFFLHPTLGYNEHFIEVPYQNLNAKLLELYFIAPWLILLIGYLGTFLVRFRGSLRLNFPLLFGTSNGNVSEKPTDLLAGNRSLVPLFPGLDFFSRTRLNAVGLSVYRYPSMIAWWVALGLGVVLMRLLGTSVLGATVVCGAVLLAYGWGSKWRTSLFLLMVALCTQYYFYNLSGLALTSPSLSEPALKVAEHGFYTVILLANLWAPMPMGALAFYTMDQFYYHSPYNEQLFWIVWVAGAAMATRIVRRRVVTPLKRKN